MGIIRRLDELGRLTIPMEVRRAWGIDRKEQAEMDMDFNGIKLVVRPKDQVDALQIYEKLKYSQEIRIEQLILYKIELEGVSTPEARMCYDLIKVLIAAKQGMGNNASEIIAIEKQED